MDSLKLEQCLQESFKEKIITFEGCYYQVKDYSWLTIGLLRLFRSRQALSNSFAFAYFIFGNDIFKDGITKEQNAINQNLFEDQQQQLEQIVEQLSKLLKEIENSLTLNMDENCVDDTRLEVIRFSNLTDGLCMRMYEVIENDLLGSWGSLKLATHHIPPYKTKGAEKTSI